MVLLFEACDALMASSGLVTVTVAGVVLGNLETRVGRDLREFKDQLTVLLVGMLFILLAADVALDDVRALGRNGLVVVAGLVLVIRPLGVWIATRGTKLPTREQVFIGAIAPRGIVAAAIASITAAPLETQGLEGGAALRALVFSTIASTVVLSGVLAYPLARLLDLRLPQRDRVAIFGARGLGLPLADALRDGNVPVLFIEPDPNGHRSPSRRVTRWYSATRSTTGPCSAHEWNWSAPSSASRSANTPTDCSYAGHARRSASPEDSSDWSRWRTSTHGVFCNCRSGRAVRRPS